MYKNKLMGLVLLVCLFFLSGCGTMHSWFFSKPKDTAQEIYRAGKESMQEEDYTAAIDYFKKLKKKFPFSPYTVKGELRLADAYFQEDRLMEAEKSYKDFESLHPGHEKIPYVLFRIGLCNFKRFRAIDLPLTDTKEALQYFQRVKQSYPTSEYAKKAVDYIEKCKLYLARHEIYVANFYWNTEKYAAAWKRYQSVMQKYEDMETLYNYAKKRSKMAYLKLQESLAAEKRREKQGSWKDWFEWL